MSPRRDFTYQRPSLYPKQREALFGAQRYAVIEAATKTGKTVGAIAWLVEQAVKGRPGDYFWWIAPVSAQSGIAFERVKRMLPRTMYTANETQKIITLRNRTTLCFKSGDHPDSLYGEDVRAAVIDEATRCKEAVWVAVRTTLTATRGPIRIIGNVKGRRNWVYHLARQAEAGRPDMHYARLIALDAVAAGIFPEEELVDAEGKLPAAAFRELYFAEPSDDEGNPFGLAAIAACVGPLSDQPPAVWGWDLARSRDWTVGVALDVEGQACQIERFQRPWEETIQSIIAVTGEAPALIDSTGVGDAILDRLRRVSDRHFGGYRFTASSKQQLMEGLAVAIQGQHVRFPAGQLVAELEAFEYEYTATGTRYAAPYGFNDDCVMALALAVHAYNQEIAVVPLRLIGGPGYTPSPEAELAAQQRQSEALTRHVKRYGSWFPQDGGW